jgi:hypothetical protein
MGATPLRRVLFAKFGRAALPKEAVAGTSRSRHCFKLIAATQNRAMTGRREGRHCLIACEPLAIRAVGPRGGVVTQRSAKPCTPVQFRAWPPQFQ